MTQASNTVEIIFNGKTQHVENGLPLKDFLEQFATTKDFALAINESFVPKSYYAQIRIHNGDNIELLTPMQGG